MEVESTRQQKVARQIQKDLAEIIRQKGMGTYKGAMVSVTGVKVSPDLSFAKVYLSIFPSNQSEQVLKIVNESSKSLRGELGRMISKQFRIVSELAFFIDDSLDYIEKIDQLLKQ